MISQFTVLRRSTCSEMPAGGAARPRTPRPFWFARRCLALVVCVVAGTSLSGCGGDKEGESESKDGGCFIAVSVGGSLNYEQTHRDLFCLYLTSFESGISTVFIPYDEPFDGITLDVDEIGIDEVGTFPASLTFSHQDGRTFLSDDCEVTVESHAPDGEESESGLSYHFRGSGSCASPASSPGDPNETLTITEFEFASGVIWGQ